MTLVHIIAGLLAILTGAVAFSAPKGGTLHRKSGIVFVCAMLVMSSLGAGIAAMKVMAGDQPQIQSLNVIAGTVTFYLVTTALLTVRHGERHLWIDAAAMLIALAAGILSIKFGIDALNRPRFSWFPTAPALIFGTIALLAALGDMRMISSGGLKGARRIARHLWRMGFAMFIATGSFFLGQAKVFPAEIRIIPLLAAPVVLVLLAMFYWWARVSIFKRVPLPR